MELFKPIKPRLKETYRCHADRADIFIYFHEKALSLLRRRGYYAYICSSNWTKTAAGKNLRHLLTSAATLTSIVDLADANVFEDASTYPWVLVAKREPPPVQFAAFRIHCDRKRQHRPLTWKRTHSPSPWRASVQALGFFPGRPRPNYLTACSPLGHP